MTYLTKCLDVFKITDLNSLTKEELKKAFKLLVIESHPDKNMDEVKPQYDFDFVLSAYTYLYEVITRIHGGRDVPQEIEAPEKIRTERGDEIINKLFEDLALDDFTTTFNSKFKETNSSFEQDKGYSSWLKEGGDGTSLSDRFEILRKTDNPIQQMMNERYEANISPVDNTSTSIPTYTLTEFHTTFETSVKKSEPVAMILHPDKMATLSGTLIGYDLLNETPDNYTNYEATPIYTDLYSAYTQDNTVIDKVNTYKDNTEAVSEAYEKYITERNKEIKPFEGSELEELAKYEKHKLEREKAHKESIKNYFSNNINTSYDKFINNDTSTKENNNFVINL